MKSKYQGNSLPLLIILTPFCLIAGSLFVYSSIIAYQQLYFWLKSSQYIDTSLYACFTPNKWTGIGPLAYIPESWTKTKLSSWLLHPTDWIGLHKIIVSLFKLIPIYVVGYILSCWLMVAIDDGLAQTNKKNS